MGLILTVVVIAVIRVLASIGPVQKALVGITNPVAELLDNISFNNDSIIESSDLSSQKIATLEAENIKLRDSLGVVKEQVAAYVLLKDISGLNKSLVIDKGSSSSVEINDPVLYDGQLIGIINKVDAVSANVQLISDPGFRVTGRVQGKNANGIIKTVMGTVVYDLVPLKRLSGESIISDGVDGVIQPGLFIGVVGRDITPSDAVLNRYQLSVGTNPANIDLVQILTTKAGR